MAGNGYPATRIKKELFLVEFLELDVAVFDAGAVVLEADVSAGARNAGVFANLVIEVVQVGAYDWAAVQGDL